VGVSHTYDKNVNIPEATYDNLSSKFSTCVPDTVNTYISKNIKGAPITSPSVCMYYSSSCLK
jgi:hypothetical protein